MLGALEAAMKLATEVLKLINTKEAKRHQERLASLRQDLLDEEAKGYSGIDSRIEYLSKAIKLEMEAATNEILASKLAAS